MKSCIYHGAVGHTRHTPAPHAFRYRMFMLYLDLAELDRVFAGRWLWSARRPALAWFRRGDHWGDPAIPLDEAIRALVAERTGRRPGGAISLLTHLRYLGYGFNPVNFFYCFDESGLHVETVVLQVNNTPWGERHAYVLPAADGGAGRLLDFTFGKDFHVSPFMGMAMEYRCRISAPGAALTVRMENHEGGAKILDVSMGLRRAEITGLSLAMALLAHPFMTGKVIAAIYFEALRLWIRRVPLHAHPTLIPKESEADPS